MTRESLLAVFPSLAYPPLANHSQQQVTKFGVLNIQSGVFDLDRFRDHNNHHVPRLVQNLQDCGMVAL